MGTPFLVGVAGGSGSGKTTVAERLAGLIGEPDLALVRLDAYYRDRNDLPFEARAAINYDHPDAFDWPLLLDHVKALQQGLEVQVPVYDFATYERQSDRVVIAPARVVVVEGILVLYEPELQGAVRSAGLRRHRCRRALHPSPRTGRGRAGALRPERDRPVPRHGAAQPRAVHRAEQAPRRCDRPARWHERTGARCAAGQGPRAPVTRHDPPEGGSWALQGDPREARFEPRSVPGLLHLHEGGGPATRTDVHARSVQDLTHVVHLPRRDVQARRGAPTSGWMLDRASGDAGSSDEEPGGAEVVAGAIQHVGPPSVAGHRAWCRARHRAGRDGRSRANYDGSVTCSRAHR